MDRWERLDEAIDRTETIIIVLFLSAMMLIAFLQDFSSKCLYHGLTWVK